MKMNERDIEEKITRDEYRKLNKEEKTRISRMPLSNSDISTLINTAINNIEVINFTCPIITLSSPPSL